MKRKKFKFRAFTALIVLWSFIVENITGIVLYVVPPGRIAHWTNWKLWGFTKEQWAALHTIFGYIFLIFAVIHICYNWKAILNYIKQKIKAWLRMRMEVALSLFLAVSVFVATAASIPPFSTVMDFGEKMKNSWEESTQEPQVPHAEEMSLDEMIERIGISRDEALRLLEKEGIIIENSGSIIKDIARKFKTSPVAIFEILEKDTPKKKSRGSGYGRKTLENLAQDLDISLEEILAFLRSEGIDVQKSDMIRDIAEKSGLTPHELVDLIQKTKK